MAKTPIIYLVRHGSTELNGSGQLRGWSDAELTFEGKKEAQAAAEELSELINRPAKLYTSDLKRAEETAHYIHREVGGEILMTKSLRPWNAGVLTATEQPNLDEIISHYTDDLDDSPENGESMRTFIHRLLGFMTKVFDEAEGGISPIVCVTSIRPIEAIIGWIESGMRHEKIDSKWLIAKDETVKPGGLVELTGDPKGNWDYEVIDIDDNEANEDDDLGEKNSHRPSNVMGYYGNRKGY